MVNENVATTTTIPAPSSTDTLTAQNSITQAGRRIFRTQWEKLRACEAAVRLGEDIEAIHDMRVASRRMRSAFRLLRAYYTNKELKGLLKPLRELARTLGAVRDWDVLLWNARAYAETLPTEQHSAFTPLLSAWDAQRAQAHQAVVAFLSRKRYAQWLLRMQPFVTLETSSAAPRVCEVVPLLIWEHYQDVRHYEVLIDDAPLTTLHELRIACKRLRYALEFFAAVLGEPTKSLIKTLAQAQDQLGELHDADVASHIVADFNARQASDEALQQAATAYVNHLHAVMAERHAKFLTRWESILAPTFRQRLAERIAAL
jgi:CHAD domain-containing protein